MVIDQLPTWNFDRYAPLFRGGIGRLLASGTYYVRGVFPYAATFTAPGHAALATGAPPSVTGILANRWFDRDTGKPLQSVEDKDHPLLSITRATPPPPSAPAAHTGDAAPHPPHHTLGGASPRRLRVETVGDALRAQTGGRAAVVSVSLKDRGAVLLGGHRPTLAVWYDPAQAAMTTSSYFARTPPAWLETLAAERPIAPRLAMVWTPLDPALLARATGSTDDAPGEAAVDGFDTTFPHDLGQTPKPAEALAATPLGDEIVLEAALAALAGEALGMDDVPDLLLISFSAHDYVGHTLGQESWEALDLLLRLDRSIGALLDRLDERVGAGRYAVLLTSDHGAARTIERSVAAGRRAMRVDPTQVEAAAEAAAASIAGAGDWVSYSRDPTLYLSAAARALPDEVRDRVLDAIVSAVGALDGVGVATRTDRAAHDCARREEMAAAVCWALDPERSGEVFYGPVADSIVMAPPFEATTHGSGNPDDTNVPILLYVPGRPPRRVEPPVSTLRVAPTVANLLGITPPAGATEPPF